MSEEHLLTIELDNDGKQVFIHGDPQGLELLAKSLSRLAEGARQGKCEHDHLYSENWGSWELTTEPQQEIGVVADHLKIYAWPTVEGGRPYAKK